MANFTFVDAGMWFGTPCAVKIGNSPYSLPHLLQNFQTLKKVTGLLTLRLHSLLLEAWFHVKIKLF